MAKMTGELLARWRAAKGLSQEALGELMDPPMAASLYRGYESGKSSPTVRQLVKLARALGIEGDSDAQRLATFFLGPGAGSEPKTAYFSHDNSHPENYRLGRPLRFRSITILSRPFNDLRGTLFAGSPLARRSQRLPAMPSNFPASPPYQARGPPSTGGESRLRMDRTSPPAISCAPLHTDSRGPATFKTNRSNFST
jgi:transcriptional regulator with XRE-family HTH domain